MDKQAIEQMVERLKPKVINGNVIIPPRGGRPYDISIPLEYARALFISLEVTAWLSDMDKTIDADIFFYSQDIKSSSEQVVESLQALRNEVKRKEDVIQKLLQWGHYEDCD